MTNFTPITTILFDLDGTLYDPENGLWQEIGQNIERYLEIYLQIPADQVQEVKLRYYRQYGTTLRGLMANHRVDPHHYMDFVHDIAVEKYLAPDAGLKNLLSRLPQACWIFTNASTAHADRVLNALGIRSFFKDIISVERIDFDCKPLPAAYEKTLKIIQEDAARVLFLDDSTRNLQAAQDFGIRTIRVGSTSPHPAAAHSIIRPHDLEKNMPELFLNGANHGL